MADGHVDGAPRPRELQELRLQIAVERLQLCARAVELRTHDDRARHAALREHDHAVLRGAEFLRFFGLEQTVGHLHLELGRSATEFVQVPFDLALHLVDFRKERRNPDLVLQALRHFLVASPGPEVLK